MTGCEVLDANGQLVHSSTLWKQNLKVFGTIVVPLMCVDDRKAESISSK